MSGMNPEPKILGLLQNGGGLDVCWCLTNRKVIDNNSK
jgi:hypothetical protein